MPSYTLPTEPSSIPTCKSIREFVEKQIAMRDSLAGPEVATPSKYWLYFIDMCRYVRSLPDEELALIRFHTWHLTGDNYQGYFFDALPQQAVLLAYKQLTDSLDNFRPSEAVNGIGFETEFGTISQDVTRYLRVMSDLYSQGAISKTSRQNVLEIGGGYGGLARLIMEFNPQTSYVICDLEEVLFFSAIYLLQTLGSDRVELIDIGAISKLELQPGKCYLLPQKNAELLAQSHFDITLNQQSMQEMSTPQIRRYCDLLEKCSKLFYSCNMDAHSTKIVNTAQTVHGLHEYLESRFTRIWDSASASANLHSLSESSEIPQMTSSQNSQLDAQQVPILPLMRRLRSLLSRAKSVMISKVKTKISSSKDQALAAQAPLSNDLIGDGHLRRVIFRCKPQTATNQRALGSAVLST